ncbi:MAG: hypothetical protein JSW20_13040 [Nitrospiraceae bacterium]|nr:MAG: hypothetical protein JSW20_13040 [Nitrospiraceae bacterium]
MRNDKSDTLASLTEKLYTLNMKRADFIFSLLHGKEMVHGIPLEVFRKCGKKKCKCYTGKKHGPYPALSVNKDGTQKIVMIKKNDSSSVLKRAGRYRHYQQTLAKIRRIDKEIDSILVKIKLDTTTEYLIG